MKVLQIITSLNVGGAENLVVEVSKKMNGLGTQVDLLSLVESHSSFLEKKAMKSPNSKVFFLGSGSPYNPLLIIKIIPFLKKYDIIHVHLFPALYWVVLANWISFSFKPIVYTEHSNYNRRRDSILFKFLDRWIYKGVSKIITISKEVDISLKNHLGNVSTEIIHNGIDLEKLRSAPAFSRQGLFREKDFIVTQVSSFRYPKDQSTVVKALNLLPKEVKVMLIGDGPLRGEVEALVSELGLGSRVSFLGLREDVPNLLQMSDAVVLSSHYEGMSLSSIEGMALKPFIATDVQGLDKMVSQHGLLFKIGDTEKLAEYITKLYEDPVFYEKIKKGCSARADEFDLSKTYFEYLKIYERLAQIN